MAKIDLHIHTPASICFSDPVDNKTCDRLVQHAIDVGLDMVAVTDHHSVEYVDKMRQAAQGTPLVVLPGVELSTCLGDVDSVYFLAIFQEDTPHQDLRDLLIELGIDSTAWGNCHYRIKKPVDFIIQKVQSLGGLLISDHLDKTEERRRAFPSLISDYGIRLFDLKRAEFASEVEKMIPDGDKACCFTFSDAHGTYGMGNIFSEVPLANCSWQGFKDWTGQ